MVKKSRDFTELFRAKKLFDIQTDYSPSLREWAEGQLGVRLPESYIALLKQRNGGTLRMNAFKLRGRGQKARAGKPYTFDRVAGIDRKHHESITALTETARRWVVPGWLFPIDGDGHWWLCLDYRRCGPTGEPQITHVDTEGEGEFRVAESFHELVSGLFFDAGALVFAIDDPELSGDQFHHKLVALGCKGKHPPNATAQDRKKTPRMWDWPAYHRENGEAATAIAYENDTPDPWTLARPAGHPLLLLDVGRKDQQRCVRHLGRTFGDSIALIHQPGDRRAIRGLAPQKRSRRRRPPQPVELKLEDLNSAVMHDDRKLVKALLEKGARPDVPYHGPRTATAISIAVAYGKLAFLKLFLRYTRRPLDRVLLSRAASNGHTGVMKVLIAHGLKPIPEDLTAAIEKDHVPVVRLLLSLGVKPSPQGIRRAAGIVEPGLEIAGFTEEPHLPILRLLKKAGAIPPDAKTRRVFDSL